MTLFFKKTYLRKTSLNHMLLYYVCQSSVFNFHFVRVIAKMKNAQPPPLARFSRIILKH